MTINLNCIKKFSDAGRYIHSTPNLPNLTNRQWLKSLLKDKADRLAGFGESISEVSAGAYPPGRSLEDFQMDSATDIGGDRKGIVMKIRRLPRNLPVGEWTRVASKVYEIVEFLNAPERIRYDFSHPRDTQVRGIQLDARNRT